MDDSPPRTPEAHRGGRPPAVIISTLPILQGFLAEITPGTTLYIDLEGANLSRHGTLTLLTAHLQPQNSTYLIDVQSLGRAAFTTPARTAKTTSNATWPSSPPNTPPRNPQTSPQTPPQTPPRTPPPNPHPQPYYHSSPSTPPTEPRAHRQHQRTLKALLQDPTIEKCLWDARADADALYWLYGVRLAGVFDLQLLEFLTRPVWNRGLYVRGLAKCVEGDLLGVEAGGDDPVWGGDGNGFVVRGQSEEVAEWLGVKKAVKEGLGREGGFAGDLFSARPLGEGAVRYCVGDVVVLPRLRALYMRREGVGLGTAGLVLMESSRRVEAAIGEVQCNPKDMALGPTVVHD